MARAVLLELSNRVGTHARRGAHKEKLFYISG